MAERKWYENPDAFNNKGSNVSPRSEGPRDYVLRALSKLLGDDNKAMRLAIKLEPVLNSPQFLYDFGKDATSAVSHALNGHYEAAKDSGVKAGIGALSMAAPAVGGAAVRKFAPKIGAYEPSLATFLEGSKAPPQMYHGTNQWKILNNRKSDTPSGMYHPGAVDTATIDQFKGTRGDPSAPVQGFAAYEPEFAEVFTGSEEALPNIYPLRVRATNPFDIGNPAHRKAANIKTKNPLNLNYNDIEKNTHKIQMAGFDSYYDFEHGTHVSPQQRAKPTGIGVFDPGQIKSQFAEKFDYTSPLLGNAKGGVVIDDGNPAKRRKLI